MSHIAKKPIIISLVFSTVLLLNFSGCGPARYTKDFNIPTPSISKKNLHPIPTTLIIEEPTVNTNKIPMTIKGNFIQDVNINSDQLATTYKSTLYNTLKSSMVYEKTTQQSADTASFHTVETNVKLHDVDLDGWTVWSNHRTNVDVDYLIRSNSGDIIEKGTVTEEGHFNEGHPGFSMQEKMRFAIEPIQKALSNTAKSISEKLIESRFFVTNANRDVLQSRDAKHDLNNTSNKYYDYSSVPIQKESKASNYYNNIGSKWAIVIGISEYQYTANNGLNNLIFADDDAKTFAHSLRTLGWNNSHIKLLVNKKATKRQILIAIESWLSKAGPNDQVILFWAGHGYPDPENPEKVYFATYDTDISIPATGYRMDRVRNALEEIGAKNVILLADTCHAGKLITRGDRGISITTQIHNMQRRGNVPKGWIFMVGADTDRQAVEHTSWRNGAFTHSLIKGLKGEADGFQSIGPKDGTVTMGELRAYMNTAMPDETQRILGVAKRPVITTSSGDPDIWNLTLQVAQ